MRRLLLGFAGPKEEAEEIRDRIRRFLRDDLALELSESKTLITHAVSQAARFLGYEIRTQMANDRLTRGQRAVNSHLALLVPRDVIRKRCALYTKTGKPAPRGLLTRDEDYSIVAKYGAEYRGVVQYYLLAQDVFRLKRLEWVMIKSMLKTLAAKHRTSAAAMARKYKAVADTPEGPRRCFEVTVPRPGKKPLVARFGGIPLKRRRTAALIDRRPTLTTGKNELIHRLLAEKCEMCEKRTELHVHHIRKLADLDKPGRSKKSEWVKLMARRQRKTLVVCRSCHQNIHAGRATATTRKRPLESGMR